MTHLSEDKKGKFVRDYILKLIKGGTYEWDVDIYHAVKAHKPYLSLWYFKQIIWRMRKEGSVKKIEKNTRYKLVIADIYKEEERVSKLKKGRQRGAVSKKTKEKQIKEEEDKEAVKEYEKERKRLRLIELNGDEKAYKREEAEMDRAETRHELMLRKEKLIQKQKNKEEL